MELFATSVNADEIYFILPCKVSSLDDEVVKTLTKLSTFWFKWNPRSTPYSLKAIIEAKS